MHGLQVDTGCCMVFGTPCAYRIPMAVCCTAVLQCTIAFRIAVCQTVVKCAAASIVADLVAASYGGIHRTRENARRTHSELNHRR